MSNILGTSSVTKHEIFSIPYDEGPHHLFSDDRNIFHPDKIRRCWMMTQCPTNYGHL